MNFSFPLNAVPAKRILTAGADFLAHRVERRDPFAAQSSILKQLISRGSSTRFGREHGFSRLSGGPFGTLYQQFARNVPIRTYEDFWRDYFSAGYRESEGKRFLQLKDVTWPGKISFFCET